MRFIIASLLTVLVTPTAMAEGPEGGTPQQPIMQPAGQPQPAPQPQYQPQPAPQPQYQPQPAPQPQYQPQQQQPVAGTQGRGIEYGLALLFPIFAQEGINPGLGLQLRGGWEFGHGFTAELDGGVLVNSYHDAYSNELRDAGVIADGHSNIWFGAGVRYMFFNPTAFVPMVGAGVQLNIWNLCVDEGTSRLVCDGDGKVNLGLTGMVGAAYEISPYVAIEGGLQMSLTGGTPAFEDGAAYLSPFIGGTLYY